MRISNLAEQHVVEYVARLKHIDELLERAARAAERHVDVAGQDVQPPETTQGPDELTRHIEKLKSTRAERWQDEAFEKAGPMAVWDAVAGRLERLVERLEA